MSRLYPAPLEIEVDGASRIMETWSKLCLQLPKDTRVMGSTRFHEDDLKTILRPCLFGLQYGMGAYRLGKLIRDLSMASDHERWEDDGGATRTDRVV